MKTYRLYCCRSNARRTHLRLSLTTASLPMRPVLSESCHTLTPVLLCGQSTATRSFPTASYPLLPKQSGPAPSGQVPSPPSNSSAATAVLRGPLEAFCFDAHAASPSISTVQQAHPRPTHCSRFVPFPSLILSTHLPCSHSVIIRSTANRSLPILRRCGHPPQPRHHAKQAHSSPVAMQPLKKRRRLSNAARTSRELAQSFPLQPLHSSTVVSYLSHCGHCSPMRSFPHPSEQIPRSRSCAVLSCRLRRSATHSNAQQLSRLLRVEAMSTRVPSSWWSSPPPSQRAARPRPWGSRPSPTGTSRTSPSRLRAAEQLR